MWLNIPVEGKRHFAQAEFAVISAGYKEPHALLQLHAQDHELSVKKRGCYICNSLCKKLYGDQFCFRNLTVCT